MTNAAPSERTLRIEESLPTRWGADADDVAEAVKRLVLEHAGRTGTTPSVIRLRLGERLPFTDEQVVRALARLARGTLFENATVRIERIASRWFCPGCDRNLHAKRCRSCGIDGVLEAGEEMVLDGIDG